MVEVPIDYNSESGIIIFYKNLVKRYIYNTFIELPLNTFLLTPLTVQ